MNSHALYTDGEMKNAVATFRSPRREFSVFLTNGGLEVAHTAMVVASMRSLFWLVGNDGLGGEEECCN